MKTHSYGALIAMSWNRTAEILFKPFNFKKWIILGIIIVLAGQAGGFNFNIGGNKADIEKAINQITKESPSSSGEIAQTAPAGPSAPENLSMPDIRTLPIFSNPKKAMLLVLIVGGVLLLLGLLLFLWMWVQANFSFVFIESVIKNDASIRVPFHRNKPQGNSYLMWNICFSSAAILLLCAIIIPPAAVIMKSGMLTGKAAFDIAKIFSIVMPYIAPLIAGIVVLVLVAMIVVDFILPVMYAKRIGIVSAWRVFRGFFSHNYADVLLYFLVKLGLGILAILASIAIIIAGLVCFLLAAGLSGFLGWLIYLITPQAAKAGVLIVLLVLGVGILIVLAALFMLLFLPIPVFFRLFSLYVLGSMDESLDVFAPAVLAQAEGEDISRYKKSMRLVWFTVLSPFIFIILILGAAAAGYFISARQSGIPVVKSITDAITRKKPAVDKAIKPIEKPVTVHLKNGNSFKASIERESKNNILFAVEGGTFILPRSDILRIEQ